RDARHRPNVPEHPALRVHVGARQRSPGAALPHAREALGLALQDARRARRRASGERPRDRASPIRRDRALHPHVRAESPVWSATISGSSRRTSGSSTSVALLEISKIDVFYGRVQALRGVTLSVDAGEIVALIGSNGAGKTTTLRTISGLMHPTTGTISFNGRQ